MKNDPAEKNETPAGTGVNKELLYNNPKSPKSQVKPANSFTAFELEKQYPIAIKIAGGGFVVVTSNLLFESVVDLVALCGGGHEFRLQLPEQSIVLEKDEAKRVARLIGGAV
jgi:hypothetical protein